MDIFPLYIPLKPHNRPLSLKAFRVVLLEFSILASKISSSGMLRAVNEDILSVKFRVQHPHGKTLVFIYCHNSLLIFYFVSTLRQYCMISEISTAFFLVSILYTQLFQQLFYLSKIHSIILFKQALYLSFTYSYLFSEQ